MSEITTPTKKPLWRRWKFWAAVVVGILILGQIKPRDGHSSSSENQSLTKDEWKRKVAAHFPIAGNHLQTSSGEFISIMGKPNRQQTVHGDFYWYYNCDDGKIQLVMQIDPHTGMLVAEINEY